MWIGRFALVIAVFLVGSSLAEADAADDDKFDEGVRMMGFQVGQAYQCVPDKEQHSVESEVLRRFTEIARLFGTDRAFLFAAAYGAGSTATVDKSRCDTLLKRLKEGGHATEAGGKAKP